MNFKALTSYTLDARKFEALALKFRFDAQMAIPRLRLSINSKARKYEIEAEKARGEIAAIIFGYQHYKGAEKMKKQAELNPCYQ